jgi:hypothetical protein
MGGCKVLCCVMTQSYWKLMGNIVL